MTAGGARHALEILRVEAAIDLVLADIIMPGMRGTELVRELVGQSPRTRCVLMSGGVIDRTEVPKGVPVLRKPFRIGDLLTTINQALTAPV